MISQVDSEEGRRGGRILTKVLSDSSTHANIDDG